jgi:hypothetical protein
VCEGQTDTGPSRLPLQARRLNPFPLGVFPLSLFPSPHGHPHTRFLFLRINRSVVQTFVTKNRATSIHRENAPPADLPSPFTGLSRNLGELIPAFAAASAKKIAGILFSRSFAPRHLHRARPPRNRSPRSFARISAHNALLPNPHLLAPQYVTSSLLAKISIHNPPSLLLPTVNQPRVQPAFGRLPHCNASR